GLDVVLLAGVVAEVVELDRRQALRLGAPGARGAPAAGVGAEGELPRALADRERAVDRVVHSGFAERAPGRAEQVGQKVHAVLARALRQRRPDDPRAGGQQVGQADRVVAGRARLDPAWPARDERDAVAPLEDVGLVAAERAARVVTLADELI